MQDLFGVEIDALISKPFSAEELLESIDEALEKER